MLEYVCVWRSLIPDQQSIYCMTVQSQDQVLLHFWNYITSFFKIRITESHLIQTLTIYYKTWIYWVLHIIIIKNKKKIESNLKCQKPDNLKSDNLISGKLAESDELFQLVSNLLCHITLSSSAVVAGLERTQWVSLSRGRRPRHSALLSCNIDDKFSHRESPVSTCSVCMMY